MGLIHPMVQLDRLHDVQLVIEAIPEDLALKQELFCELNRVCRPPTVLASNTSSISITKLGAASGRPDRVVGLHFMNPAPVMRLVEVVRGLETSEHTVSLAIDLAKGLGMSVWELLRLAERGGAGLKGRGPGTYDRRGKPERDTAVLRKIAEEKDR